jgi:hypothetical protein
VPALDRGAEAASESRLLLELAAGLLRHCSIQLRPADEAEPEEELSEPLAGLVLSLQSLVEAAAVNRSLCHKNRSQQGSVAAGVVHVSPQMKLSSTKPPRAPGGTLKMHALGKKWNPPI